ncbi:MAG TPA: hypothetical protein VGG45_12650 [Terracidiphilus sp.]|jgi:hypothetical protein
MRWLFIVFLVSLGALLIAAAGAARHIWLHRSKLGNKPPSVDPGERPDLELKS